MIEQSGFKRVQAPIHDAKGREVGHEDTNWVQRINGTWVVVDSEFTRLDQKRLVRVTKRMGVQETKA